MFDIIIIFTLFHISHVADNRSHLFQKASVRYQFQITIINYRLPRGSTPQATLFMNTI